MKVHCLQGRTTRGFTTFGGYWAKGEAPANTAFSLTDTAGDPIPVQSKPMAYWPDGSIKWSAHTADAALLANGSELFPCPAEPCKVDGIHITETDTAWQVDTGAMQLCIPRGTALPTAQLAENITRNGRCYINAIYPVFVLERRSMADGAATTTDKEYHGTITRAECEESGLLQAVFAFNGCYVQGEECTMPFVVRMALWAGSCEMKFTHTFLFDGVEQRDYLKGMGLRFDAALTGPAYNHQIQYLREDHVFHEPAMLLFSRFPRIGFDVEREQLTGALAHAEPTEAITEAVQDLPQWDHYHLWQQNAHSYSIIKRTKPECCWLNARQGHRAPGVMAVIGADGGLVLGMRDFWQKYPGGLAADGLGQQTCACTLWFYTPQAEAYDFRHYDTKSYPMTCYEGFKEVRSTAYGIGVTSECRAQLVDTLPDEAALRSFAAVVQKPAVITANSDYYYKKRAFGYWSLPKTSTPALCEMEEQLSTLFDFYKREVDARDWYGLFDYGDVMHSYDPVRHCWRYDVGGFAWHNTELVPTYWLWYYFLRTGREDVFTMAEAMSRHTSEVDVYHFGPLQGLGSRHNVRHWGCSCKEPRIAMAGHHRFMYYLTGDARIGDVMEDVKDADRTLCANPHNQIPMPDGTVKSNVRSGPDWSSFVSNWMTHYERTLDETYRKKIETGIRDIAATPYGFASGPDYYYDLDTAHLIYHGEIEDTPNQHLQICMGGPQIWLEAADMLEDDTLCTLLQRLGAFYYLPAEEKARLTDGKIKNRPFSNIMLATAVTAYNAGRSRDRALAEKTWQILLDDLKHFTTPNGVVPRSYVPGQPDDGAYQELPGISTGSSAQWSLNTICALEFIPDALPEEVL